MSLEGMCAAFEGAPGCLRMRKGRKLNYFFQAFSTIVYFPHVIGRKFYQNNQPRISAALDASTPTAVAKGCEGAEPPLERLKLWG